MTVEHCPPTTTAHFRGMRDDSLCRGLLGEIHVSLGKGGQTLEFKNVGFGLAFWDTPPVKGWTLQHCLEKFCKVYGSSFQSLDLLAYGCPYQAGTEAGKTRPGSSSSAV